MQEIKELRYIIDQKGGKDYIKRKFPFLQRLTRLIGEIVVQKPDFI